MSKLKLRELIDSYGDGIHGTPEYDDNGAFYFINGNNIVDGKIQINNNTLRISEEEYNKIKRPLGENTLLISINGTLGRVAVYNYEKIALGKSACYINVKDKCNKYFVKYVLSTQEFQKYIQLVAHGSTIKNLAPSQVCDYEFYFPELLDTDKTAYLLKSLDDKIENNNKINFELESLAKTIYDYWFLQFDFPNEEGKPYKSSGGKMVWSEELKREIPENWEVKEIRSFINIIRGVSYDKLAIRLSKESGYIPLLKANNIDNGVVNFDNLVYVKSELVSEDQMLDKNSIFITMSSGSKKHMGKTTIIYNDIPYTYGAFCSKIVFKEIYRAYLSTYFRSTLFKTSINQLSIGTNINNINNDHIYGLKIPFPNQEVLKEYEDIVNPILDKRGEIVLENQELASLRDFLLPLLMNGQVGFKTD